MYWMVVQSTIPKRGVNFVVWYVEGICLHRCRSVKFSKEAKVLFIRAQLVLCYSWISDKDTDRYRVSLSIVLYFWKFLSHFTFICGTMYLLLLLCGTLSLHHMLSLMLRNVVVHTIIIFVRSIFIMYLCGLH